MCTFINSEDLILSMQNQSSDKIYNILKSIARYSCNLCKTAAPKKTQNWFLIPVNALCRSKVLQNAHYRSSLSYHLSLRSLLCLILSGRFTTVLMYIQRIILYVFDQTRRNNSLLS